MSNRHTVVPSSIARLCLLLVTCAMCGSIEAAPPDDGRMQWWREARFGLFIHWGLYAVPAGEWNEGTDHGEWILTTAQIPVSEYEQFVGQFNPVQFDAAEWVRIARDAGMRYIVITSKHHDGFCLFDSEHTDYDIMATPFQRDIMAELAEACREQDVHICWYHSIMDWHHPDYLPRRNWEDRPAQSAEFERYVDYMHRQVRELLTKYGDIGVMWFDGEWEATWTPEHGRALYELCRSIDPDLIINNRVDKGRAGMSGLTEDDRFLGDFDTPEQQIPGTAPPGDWETCMTMNRHWGYNSRDKDYKSTTDLVRKLVDVASKGGNFLLNVGPTAQGTFPEESIERLREIGEWMKTNGEAIHGTQRSPFDELTWGRCTVKDLGDSTRLYLHVFKWPQDGILVVPGVGNDNARAWLLDAPQNELALSRRKSGTWLRVPRQAPDAHCSVVALEVEGPAIIYRKPRVLAPAHVFVRPMNVELAVEGHALEIRYTLDGDDPTATSTLYQGPFEIRDDTMLKARTFHRDRIASAVVKQAFERVEPAPATEVSDARPGLHLEVYAGDWDALPDLASLEPDTVHMVEAPALADGPAVEYVARRYRGYLDIPRDDVYRFRLTSDDGSRLTINDDLVIDNDGLHGPEAMTGTAALAAGLHPITIDHFNKTGGAELSLEYAPSTSPPGRFEPIPPTHYRTTQ